MQNQTGLVKSGRLDHNSAEILYVMLKKRNPDILKSLDAEYREIMPPMVFKDYSLIPEFLADYCAFKNISPEDLKGRPKGKNKEYRKRFFALLLLCYHPEKILKGAITEKRTEKGLELYAAHYLQCLDKSLANILNEVVLWLETYPEFSEDVHAAHAVILEKHKDLPQHKTRAYAEFGKVNTGQLNIFG